MLLFQVSNCCGLFCDIFPVTVGIFIGDQCSKQDDFPTGQSARGGKQSLGRVGCQLGVGSRCWGG